jgi:hypothetical protein
MLDRLSLKLKNITILVSNGQKQGLYRLIKTLRFYFNSVKNLRNR